MKKFLPFLFWGGILLAFFVFPHKYLLINEIAILALFALSLDLILGYAGIVSLGHAAFFGLGAYVAGILAKAGLNDPVFGLFCAVILAALAGYITSFLVLRGHDLTKLMVTLGVAMVFGEIANQARDWTGGADGLQGIEMGALFGRFTFGFTGRTAAIYSLSLLFLFFCLAKYITSTQFGKSLEAIRDNPLRAAALGIPVQARLRLIYTLAAIFAGVAGAVLTQTTQFVSLDVFEFARSADLMLVLIIGGAGYLYGGLYGAIAFKLLSEGFAYLTPHYWHFWIGALLVALVLVRRPDHA
jgi:branched-chain amino acid transport system permease protein